MEEIGMKKRMIIIGVGAIVILTIIVPIFLDYCILGNGINSNIGNDIWMAFFGSYFGGLFGAAATMMVLYDTLYSRKKMEERNKKEQMEQRKLSIMPCLQSRERLIKCKEQLVEDNASFFITYEKGEIRQWRSMPRWIKPISDNFFVIEAEIGSVGMGSAISFNAFMDGKQFLFNDSLGVGQTLKVYFMFNREELYHRETKLSFEYSDVMGLVRYRQEETFLIYRDDKELLWTHSQYLTLPHAIE